MYRNYHYLNFTVFTAGMVTLALEISASRLLGSVFGTSNLVWASIIGLILIYLSVGYFLGGWWADKSPQWHTMFTVLAWGAFASGLVPLVSRPVLRAAADSFDQLQVGVLFGSFAAILVLFSLPVTLLGTISPFAIRLAAQDPEHIGRVSGRIYAISTIGSFTGTFLPVLVFIPLIGTTWTFIVFSELLMVTAIIGLGLSSGWRQAIKWIWMPIILLIWGSIYASKPIKSTTSQIFETESAYNYIQVLEQDGYRYLRLNEGQGVHSQWHSEELDYHGPWEQFLAAPFFNATPYKPDQIKRIAIIGLAAGTIARQATEVFGSIPIDGFEIDPEIIRVGRSYFDMVQPNLNPLAEDGRVGLRRSQRKYSFIAVDAYQPPYIPWHLTTQEFFQLAHNRLEKDGVLAINVGRSPSDRRLINGLVGTIQSIFPSIYVMDVPGTFNSIIYATKEPTDIKNFYANLINMLNNPDIHPLLLRAMESVVLNLQPTPESNSLFTDDRAPIEWITNNMVLNYVLSGEMEELEGQK